MKKDPVSKDDVRLAREELTAAGRKVTQRTILDHLGRGSFSTIAKYSAELDAEATNSAGAPAVRETLKILWEQAVAAAAQGFQVQIADVRAELAESVGEISRLESELARSEAEKAAISAQRDDVVLTLTKNNTEAERLRLAAQEQSDRAEKFQQGLSEQRERHAAQVATHSVRERELETKTAALAQKVSELELAGARTQATWEQKALRLESERDAATQRVEQNQIRLNQAQEQIDLLTRRIEQEREKTEKLRLEQSAREETWQTKLDRLYEARDELQRDYARETAALRAEFKHELATRTAAAAKTKAPEKSTD